MTAPTNTRTVLANLVTEARLGGEAEAPGALTIRLATNDPLLLSGPSVLRDAGGAVCDHGTKGALCRCGASDNKPYCDGTHSRAGFEAP